MENFDNAGIFYYYQLVSNNNNYLCCYNVEQKYNLESENELFLKFVKLCISIFGKWESSVVSPHPYDTTNNYLETAKANFHGAVCGNAQKGVLNLRIGIYCISLEKTSTWLGKQPSTEY